VTVLDCYHGTGAVWGEVNSRLETGVGVVPIDKKGGPGVLRGDNRKFIRGLPLSDFDFVDLDAYGNPFDQILDLFERHYCGGVFFTWCKVGPGLYPGVLRAPKIREVDKAFVLRLLSGFLYRVEAQEATVVYKKKTGGFNVYGFFRMGGGISML